MSQHIDQPRRRMLGATILGLAAAPLGRVSLADAQSVQAGMRGMSATRPGRMHFGALTYADAGVLRVAYVDEGPANGQPVLLLHGWPYDIHSYIDVSPILATAGYRVIIPYLRGYGQTRFLSAGTPRNGQQAALAADALAFMDALKIKRAIVAGYDWNAARHSYPSAVT